nr:uncharacterized protein LOC132771747 isoform X1 [Anolis sagrei ordinatus]
MYGILGVVSQGWPRLPKPQLLGACAQYGARASSSGAFILDEGLEKGPLSGRRGVREGSGPLSSAPVKGMGRSLGSRRDRTEEKGRPRRVPDRWVGWRLARVRKKGRGKMQAQAERKPPAEAKGLGGKGPEAKGPEGKGPEGVGGDGPYYRYPGAALLPVHRMPRDYLVCSFITFSYANCCCLGLAALVFSIKSRDAKVIGDAEGAEEHGRTARCLNVFAVSMAIVSLIVSIIVLATTMAFIFSRFMDAMVDAHEHGTHKPVSRN